MPRKQEHEILIDAPIEAVWKAIAAMVATSYLSFGQVPEWEGVEIKYTRRSE